MLPQSIFFTRRFYIYDNMRLEEKLNYQLYNLIFCVLGIFSYKKMQDTRYKIQLYNVFLPNFVHIYHNFVPTLYRLSIPIHV